MPRDLAVDAVNRQALAVTPSHSLVRVNLANGNRTLVSTSYVYAPSFLMNGPQLRGSAHVVADFEQGLAWVTANQDSILLVDLPSGDRVITSR